MRERLAVFLLTLPAGMFLGWRAHHWWLRLRFRHGLVLPPPLPWDDPRADPLADIRAAAYRANEAFPNPSLDELIRRLNQKERR